jgi:hypothetical protein
MKLGIRTLFTLAALVALIAAGSAYWAGEQVSGADHTAGDARVATFKSYRIAQSLKAMAAGYELTMNEFYSTVLELPVYREKSATQKKAIENELTSLVGLQESDAAAAVELARLFTAMDRFRADLEKAIAGEEKNWDAAREALFKLNVLSVQAIQQADSIGQSASQRASALDAGLQIQQSRALLWLRITMALALFVAVLLFYGSLRANR